MSIHPFRVLAVFATLLLLSGCGKDDAKQNPQAAAGGAPPVTEVGVVTLKQQNVDLDVELPGRTTAFQAAEIRPQVNGIILKRMFDEGSVVKAGQQLYQIDPAMYQANYDTAVAQLKRAEATVKSAESLASRYKELIAFDGISKQELDNAQASLGQAQADIAIARAAVQTAQINLNYTKVMSPITGRIGKSSVTPGALVTANQANALALVQQLDPIYVDVTQSSADMMKLQQRINEGKVSGNNQETTVSLILDDMGQIYNHPGMLKFSDVTVDPTTANVQIRALFPNPDNQLLPGLFVRALIKQGQLTNVLLVPQQAVVRTPDGKAMAWVVDSDNKAQQKPVETSQAVKDTWIVTKGLQDGDKVIIEGTIKVQPGAVVKPVELSDKKTDASAKPQAPATSQPADAVEQSDDTPSIAPIDAPDTALDTDNDTAPPADNGQ